MLNPSGEVVGQWGSTGRGEGQFDEPEGGIAVDKSGSVYVAVHHDGRYTYLQWSSTKYERPAMSTEMPDGASPTIVCVRPNRPSTYGLRDFEGCPEGGAVGLIQSVALLCCHTLLVRLGASHC